jgi:hypothetical protein
MYNKHEDMVHSIQTQIEQLQEYENTLEENQKS